VTVFSDRNFRVISSLILTIVCLVSPGAIDGLAGPGQPALAGSTIAWSRVPRLVAFPSIPCRSRGEIAPLGAHDVARQSETESETERELEDEREQDDTTHVAFLAIAAIPVSPLQHELAPVRHPTLLAPGERRAFVPRC
jgi:hypothetical protein